MGTLRRGILKNIEFNAFKDKTIKAIVTPNTNEKTRKFFDELTSFATEEIGAKGLAWTKFDNENHS